LTVKVVAAFSGLDDQPCDVAVEQRLNHPVEALGADLGVAALAVEDQRGHLAGCREGVDDLSAATVPFLHEVPSPLAGKAEGSDQAA
jgi:hypothetical protein